VNPLRILLTALLLVLPALCLTGCATAETDADDVADNAIQGLEGKGHLYNEKVMKGDMGGQLGNDFQ
jgi:predicted small secreted protein